jgi:hypothetical protein
MKKSAKKLILQAPQDWRLIAIDELNEAEGTNFDLDEDRGPEAGAELMEEVSYMILRQGDRDYYVFRDDDEAEKYATEQVTDDLENYPENFNQSFIEGHVNTERLDDLLWSDVENMRREDYEENKERFLENYTDFDPDEAFEEGDEPDLEQLAKAVTEFVDDAATEGWFIKQYAGVEPPDDPESPEFDEAARKAKAVFLALSPEEQVAALDERRDVAGHKLSYWGWGELDRSDVFGISDERKEELMDEAFESWLEDYKDKFDGMEWLEEIYGRGGEAVKEAIRLVGINVEEAAEDAIRQDGWQNYVSSYDGNSYDLPSGAVYFFR